MFNPVSSSAKNPEQRPVDSTLPPQLGRMTVDLHVGSENTMPRIWASEDSVGSNRPLVKRSVFSISEASISLVDNGDINELIDLIEKRNSDLKDIKVISFGDINRGNKVLIQKLLDTIFKNEEELFSSFEKLIFGNICGNLSFPKFTGLETLILRDVWGKLVMADFPKLKNIEYGRGSGTYNLEQFKAALSLRGLSQIELKGCLSARDILLNLIKYPGKESNLGCIETIVIDRVRKDDFWDVKWILDCIHSNQELLSGLKRIEIDNSVLDLELKKFIVESSKLKFLELLTSLSKRIEIVYFTGCGAKPFRER